VGALRRAMAKRGRGILVRRKHAAPFHNSGVLVAMTRQGFSVRCFDHWTPGEYMNKAEFVSRDVTEVVRVFNACLTDWVDGIPGYRFERGRPLQLTAGGFVPMQDDTAVILLMDSVQKAVSPRSR
jgi:hypothetical protein